MTAAEQETPEERRTRFSRNGMTLAWWAEQRPDEPAFVAPSGSRTFAQLNGNANRLVRALRRRGLGDGDAIALACGNRAEFAETVNAASRAGFRITTVNWHLTGEEAGYIIGNCEAKALIADAAVAEMAAGSMAEAPGCRVRLAVAGPIDGFEPYDTALAMEDGVRHRRPHAGQLDALHVGHHRQAERRAPGGEAGRRRAARAQHLRLRRGRWRRPPVHRDRSTTLPPWPSRSPSPTRSVPPSWSWRAGTRVGHST